MEIEELFKVPFVITECDGRQDVVDILEEHGYKFGFVTNPKYAIYVNDPDEDRGDLSQNDKVDFRDFLPALPEEGFQHILTADEFVTLHEKSKSKKDIGALWVSSSSFTASGQVNAIWYPPQTQGLYLQFQEHIWMWLMAHARQITCAISAGKTRFYLTSDSDKLLFTNDKEMDVALMRAIGFSVVDDRK
jgi:hypothetical protein